MNIPSAINGKQLTVTRGLFRICRLRDEYYEFVHDPSDFVRQIKACGKPAANVFTFIQELTDPIPRFAYHLEWDSAAVLNLTTFEHWWKKQINDKTRNMVRKAQKAGVEMRLAEFNDELIRGIKIIYNESPV